MWFVILSLSLGWIDFHHIWTADLQGSKWYTRIFVWGSQAMLRSQLPSRQVTWNWPRKKPESHLGKRQATPRKTLWAEKTPWLESHQGHSSQSQVIISAVFPHRQLQKLHLQAAGQKNLIYASATISSLRQCRGGASQWWYFWKSNFSKKGNHFPPDPIWWGFTLLLPHHCPG